jgi:hypothetical protein
MSSQCFNRLAVSLFAVLALACGPKACLGSSKFLHDKGGSLNKKAFKEDIMNAMGSMLGCGGEADPKHVSAIKATIMPMWRTLPKTSGRVDRRTLRYLVHRYFMQTSSLMVRGFEPSRPTNDSHWGAADILSQMVPAYVESVLESKHSTVNGFTLQDATDMVLMMDQLIFDSEGSLLEGVYRDQRKPMQRSLSQQGLKQVLESYMVKWMIEAEPHEYAILLKNRTLLESVVPHFNALMQFAEGRIKTFEFDRQQQQLTGMKRSSKDSWHVKYSFEDAHKIAGGITRSFQSYWQSECESMKTALVTMDKHSTGRVPLAKFYNTAINTDWRFGESEAYLRELGALDETSSWMGPQVIIPNYLQATSNCIVSTPHYLVCCVAECETLMGEIETAIDAPTALPSAILGVVRGMTSQTSLEDDEPPHLTASLVRQLEQVAKSNGGTVPLHGRLFAQWLHYVFPRECPFPHKNGAVSSATPSQYGEDHIASQADMRKHASNATALELSVGKEELQWMSQWSEDEEFLVDYSSELGGSWSRFLIIVFGLLLAAAGVMGGAVSCGSGSGKPVKGGGMVPHSHWV